MRILKLETEALRAFIYPEQIKSKIKFEKLIIKQYRHKRHLSKPEHLLATVFREIKFLITIWEAWIQMHQIITWFRSYPRPTYFEPFWTGPHMAPAATVKKDSQWRNFLFFLDALRSCLRSRFVCVCWEPCLDRKGLLFFPIPMIGMVWRFVH